MSWIDVLRARCGPLADAATQFSTREGLALDPPRGVPALHALWHAVEAHEPRDDEDARRFIEGAGAFLALVIADELPDSEHVANGDEHGLRVGPCGWLDPFAAITRVLRAVDVAEAIAVEVACAEAEAQSCGPVSRVVCEVEAALARRDAKAEVVGQRATRLRVAYSTGDTEIDVGPLAEQHRGAPIETVRAAVRELLDDVLTDHHDGDMSWERAREIVLPRLVGPRFVARLPVTSKGPFVSPLVGELRLALVLRFDGRARFVRLSERRHWPSDAHAVALANLAKRSRAARLLHVDAEEGSFVLARSGDGLDAARLLLPGLHDVLAPELGSPFVAAVPHRDALLACPADQPETVVRMRERVQQEHATAREALSAELLTVHAGGRVRPLA